MPGKFKAVLITCFDPRFQQGVEAHFRQQYDLIVISLAGGHIQLVEQAKHNQTGLFTDIKEVAVEELKAEVVILAGHDDCKYIQKYYGTGPVGANDITLQSLHRAAEVLTKIPGIKIKKFMCHLIDGHIRPVEIN